MPLLCCSGSTLPCNGGVEACTTQEVYAAFQFGPPPQCPPPPVNGTSGRECASVNGECVFTDASVPSCVSWLPDCSTEYSCTTEADYEARTNETCSSFSVPPPTPDEVCVAQDGECRRYNPCTTWQSHCRGGYNCGSHVDFGEFLNGPIPGCVPPDPFNPRPQPRPQGECLYRNGECQWSGRFTFTEFVPELL